uniref:Uncharacterized protein n=1 Tax=Panagrolaimus davidi TaxID=227884 RepID=A0A914PSX6_9BILA
MFVKLGSPLNTLDSKRFSPLISAINTKNVELVKLLLNAGANVEKGIEYAKISGMVTEEITNILIAHKTKINLCMNQAREKIFPQAISAQYGTLPNSLHIIPMAETDTIKFPFTLAKGITLSQNHYLLFECAVIIIDQFNETISARMWHQSPIKSILINGTEPTYLQKTINFLSLPILMEGKNSIKIELLNRIYKGTKYCIASRITHVFMPGFATKAGLSVQQQGGYVDPKIRKQQRKYLQSLPSSSILSSYQQQQQQLTSKRMRPNGPYHLPTHNIRSEPPLLPSFSDYLQRPSSSSKNSAEQQQQQRDRYYPSPSFSASTIPRGFMKLRALAPTNPSTTTTAPPPSMQRGTNRPLFLPLSAASNRNGSISSSVTSVPTTKRIKTHSTTSSQNVPESSTTPRLQKQ